MLDTSEAQYYFDSNKVRVSELTPYTRNNNNNMGTATVTTTGKGCANKKEIDSMVLLGGGDLLIHSVACYPNWT